MSATCPRCSGPVSSRDRFCEACGAPTPGSAGVAGRPGTGTRCLRCGAVLVDDEDYCGECGRRRPRSRDHVEIEVAWAAAVSDLGMRHRRNEDAVALRVLDAPEDGLPTTVAVVCDGMSASTRPDEASLVAVAAGVDAVLAALRARGSPERASREGFDAASDAVVALGDGQRPGRYPASTYVSAVLTDQSITVCWVGDSRAYWVPQTPSGAPQQLTADNSWLAEVLAAGEMAPEVAAADRRAHTITAWLGADAARREPHALTFSPDGPGVVVLCTDGLWNYLEDAAALEAALPGNAVHAALASARQLVDTALRSGGHDNVTVAVLPFRRQAQSPVPGHGSVQSHTEER